MFLLLLGCPPVPGDDSAKDAQDSVADSRDSGEASGPVDTAGDCADAVEECNGLDDDCDGFTDEGVATTYYRDGDDDGFGDPLGATSLCEPVEGFVDNGGDCDDTDADVYPGAEERANEKDDDCDGETDEDLKEMSFTLSWSGDGVTVSITDGSGDYDFGMAETGAGDLGWFGESCFIGSQPWGYDDYGWDVCHTLGATGGFVESVYPDIDEVRDGYTLFPEDLEPKITYFLGDEFGQCWAWGDDASYYSSAGCSTP
ncbi:MAG: putative metal-binding motif-containing protein [Deltaproteobacteria bacterium]|nr:putative metal-binding motif-containing protein [Deltaproteobacteria bacterium]